MIQINNFDAKNKLIFSESLNPLNNSPALDINKITSNKYSEKIKYLSALEVVYFLLNLIRIYRFFID